MPRREQGADWQEPDGTEDGGRTAADQKPDWHRRKQGHRLDRLSVAAPRDQEDRSEARLCGEDSGLRWTRWRRLLSRSQVVQAGLNRAEKPPFLNAGKHGDYRREGAAQA